MQPFRAVAVMIVVGSSITVLGQAPQPTRLVGNRISGSMRWDAVGRKTTDTATCQFVGSDGRLIITIDFVAQYPGQQPTTAPTAVDIVVTEHAVDEDAPETSLSADGQSLPLNTRPRTARSVVATISFDEFVRLSKADALVERAFDRELEFGQGQLRMLRSTAERWSGGPRL